MPELQGHKVLNFINGQVDDMLIQLYQPVNINTGSSKKKPQQIA